MNARDRPRSLITIPQLVALSAVAFVLLNNIVASFVVLAAHGFDPSLFVADGELVIRDLGTAEILRWGALIDMVGYLCAAPVVLFVYSRGAQLLTDRVLAFCGLAFSLVGAIGAVLLASAGAWLLAAPTPDATSLEIVRVTYAALESIVAVGLWGTLELLLLGVWFVGVGRMLTAGDRAFGFVAVLAGVGCLAYAVRTGLTGRPPLPMANAFDIAIVACVAFLPIWMLWLAFKLLRREGIASGDAT